MLNGQKKARVFDSLNEQFGNPRAFFYTLLLFFVDFMKNYKMNAEKTYFGLKVQVPTSVTQIFYHVVQIDV